MRYLLICFTVVLPALPIGSAFAGDEAAEKIGDRPSRDEFRQRMIEKFDSDGDGKLSDEERATARKEMQGRRGRVDGERRRRGPEGHGPPSPERLFEQFDADGDERLSLEEFQRLAEATRKRLEQCRRGKGRQGKGRRPGPSPEGRPDFRPPGPLQNPGDRPGPPRPPRGARRGPDKGPGGRGPGGLGREGFRPPNPNDVFDRFDKNVDDQLSREEFMELTQAVREHIGRGRRGGFREGQGVQGGPKRGNRGRRPPEPGSDDRAGAESSLDKDEAAR